jgi:hypothetical protein
VEDIKRAMDAAGEVEEVVVEKQIGISAPK